MLRPITCGNEHTDNQKSTTRQSKNNIAVKRRRQRQPVHTAKEWLRGWRVRAYQEGQIETPPLVEQTPHDRAHDDPHPSCRLLPPHDLPELLRRGEVVRRVREEHRVLRRLAEPHSDAQEEVRPQRGPVPLRHVLHEAEENDEETL